MNGALMYILFAIGLILIIKGGDMFVDGASSVAKGMGVPDFVIGATIVSLATTLPELLVSIQATAKGNVDMATGNAVGSVTANTALILGLFIVCMPFKTSKKELAPKGLMMISASVVLFLGCAFTQKRRLNIENAVGEYYSLSVFGIIALTLIFIAFFVENFISLKKSRSQTPEANRDDDGEKRWGKNIFLFALGAIGIILGADLLVDYATRIALSLGISQRVISVIAIAVGTSLPELVTTVTAIRKKLGSLSVGNIIGANIIDLTLILPACSLVSSVKGGGALAVSSSSVLIDMPVCIAAAAIALLPTLFTGKFSRIQGIAMLLGYAFYIGGVVI